MTTHAIAVGRGIAREHMDLSVRPCEDFFRYANGHWQEATIIPAEEPVWGTGAEMRERNYAVLREILEEAAAAPAERGSIHQKVGDFYTSGMDVAAIESAGIEPLRSWLDEIERCDPEDLPSLLARMHRARIWPGFALRVDQDAKDSSRYILEVQQAGLGLPDRDYYVQDDEKMAGIRKAYVAHVARMLELLGDPAADARDGAGLIMEMETRLAHASMSRVDQRDPYKTYHKQTPSELAVITPGLDWNAYLAALGAPPLEDLDPRQPEFLAELGKMLASVPISDWRTYLRWHLVHDAAPALPAAFEDEHFDMYQRVLQGVQEQKPRWKRVLALTDGLLGEALGQLYVERAFPPEAKRRVLELVEDLRAALAEQIRGLEWMGEPTKEQALQKLAAFRVKMGYPDRWRDYSALDVDRGPFVGNVLRAEAFELERDLRKLGGPVDRDEWRMSPPTVNAYHRPRMNEIVFPAGILQSPMFGLHADDAVNYGAIGMVIGHEMTHAFDDQGSKYDAHGNLREWWQEQDRKAYEARGELVVRQFESYEPLPGARINGRLTLGENIADLGGLKIALAAFKRFLTSDRGRAARQTIDGFTPLQRFFIGFAQGLFRNKIRDEALRVRLTIDPHSPSRHRINAPLSNLPEFFDAFGCADGAAMRRPEAERPAIW